MGNNSGYFPAKSQVFSKICSFSKCFLIEKSFWTREILSMLCVHSNLKCIFERMVHIGNVFGWLLSIRLDFFPCNLVFCIIIYAVAMCSSVKLIPRIWESLIMCFMSKIGAYFCIFFLIFRMCFINFFIFGCFNGIFSRN